MPQVRTHPPHKANDRSSRGSPNKHATPRITACSLWQTHNADKAVSLTACGMKASASPHLLAAGIALLTPSTRVAASLLPGVATPLLPLLSRVATSALLARVAPAPWLSWVATSLLPLLSRVATPLLAGIAPSPLLSWVTPSPLLSWIPPSLLAGVTTPLLLSRVATPLVLALAWTPGVATTWRSRVAAALTAALTLAWHAWVATLLALLALLAWLAVLAGLLAGVARLLACHPG